MYHWKMILTSASNFYRLPVPRIGTSTDMLHLWAHWVRVWCLMLHARIVPRPRVILLHPFSHKQKPNNYTTIFFTTYARNTLCLPQRFPFSIHPTLLQYYHPRSLRNYRSDQIEQQDILHCLLISIKRISTISPVLALVLDTSAWTTIKFHSYFLRADNNNNRSGFIKSYNLLQLYQVLQLISLAPFFSSSMSGILLLVTNNSDL